MSNHNLPGDDMGTELAKELVRQLPIKEATLLAAKQTGEVLTDLIKTLQLALAPVQLLAAYQDRFRNFIDRSVRRVPEDNRVSPAPKLSAQSLRPSAMSRKVPP